MYDNVSKSTWDKLDELVRNNLEQLQNAQHADDIITFAKKHDLYYTTDWIPFQTLLRQQGINFKQMCIEALKYVNEEKQYYLNNISTIPSEGTVTLAVETFMADAVASFAIVDARTGQAYFYDTFGPGALGKSPTLEAAITMTHQRAVRYAELARRTANLKAIQLFLFTPYSSVNVDSLTALGAAVGVKVGVSVRPYTKAEGMASLATHERFKLDGEKIREIIQPPEA